MGMNERAVVADNLRTIIGRYRANPEPWSNFKAVAQGQIKFDVMNISDAIETQIRKGQDVLKKLLDDDYLDPVLGRTQLETLSNGLISNIIARNGWEDSVAPAIARELRDIFDLSIPRKIHSRLSDADIKQFYLGFAHQLGMADSPDRDSFAVSLGRRLYNLANYSGTRRDWYRLGNRILEKNAGHLFEIDTYGVQKRRMRSRLSGQYFGPYYETTSYYINIKDPRIVKYAKLNREIDMGMRVGVTDPKNRLIVREGYKTYFVDRGILGLYDTRIPIMSTHSFADFPASFIDKDFVDAMNWAAKAEYTVDEDFYNFINKLMFFKDDRGNAAKYDNLNHYENILLVAVMLMNVLKLCSIISKEKRHLVIIHLSIVVLVCTIVVSSALNLANHFDPSLILRQLNP
jgi:hypothetical protein